MHIIEDTTKDTRMTSTKLPYVLGSSMSKLPIMIDMAAIAIPMDATIPVCLTTATVAEAENMLAKFTASGADLTMPLAPVAWGAHYGQVTDRYGVLWAVNAPAESDPAAG